MPEQDLLQVKRDKLTQLVNEGKDPFKITKYDVTHHAAEIKDNFDNLDEQFLSNFQSVGNTTVFLEVRLDSGLLDRVEFLAVADNLF